jgi:hypothetical protein
MDATERIRRRQRQFRAERWREIRLMVEVLAIAAVALWWVVANLRS